jgi:hypothetical protein
MVLLTKRRAAVLPAAPPLPTSAPQKPAKGGKR